MCSSNMGVWHPIVSTGAFFPFRISSMSRYVISQFGGVTEGFGCLGGSFISPIPIPGSSFNAGRSGSESDGFSDFLGTLVFLEVAPLMAGLLSIVFSFSSVFGEGDLLRLRGFLVVVSPLPSSGCCFRDFRALSSRHIGGSDIGIRYTFH
jgi:hypothetical protein